MTCVYSLLETVTELSQNREMRFFRLLSFVTVLETKAQSEEIKDNNSGLFEFPKLEWPSPKTFIGYLSNFTHRVADIVNDVKLDSLSETEFFEIPDMATDFELGNFTLTELEDFILNSIRNFSIIIMYCQGIHVFGKGSSKK